jgi:hypothetical protein
MNIGEASLISSGLAVIKVENEKFIADLGDVIRETMKDASNMDLILLTKGSFYMRKFNHTSDIYSKVHAVCMQRFNLKQFTDQEMQLLKTLYTT